MKEPKRARLKRDWAQVPGASTSIMGTSYASSSSASSSLMSAVTVGGVPGTIMVSYTKTVPTMAGTRYE